jgi:hypothetical protein
MNSRYPVVNLGGRGPFMGVPVTYPFGPFGGGVTGGQEPPEGTLEYYQGEIRRGESLAPLYRQFCKEANERSKDYGKKAADAHNKARAAEAQKNYGELDHQSGRAKIFGDLSVEVKKDADQDCAYADKLEAAAAEALQFLETSEVQPPSAYPPTPTLGPARPPVPTPGGYGRSDVEQKLIIDTGPEPVRPPVPTGEYRPRYPVTYPWPVETPQEPVRPPVPTPGRPPSREGIEPSPFAYLPPPKPMPPTPIATPGGMAPPPLPTEPPPTETAGPQLPKEPPPVASTMCPPGQFWDGRQCRGSIAPGAAGLISAAGGLTAGGMTSPVAYGMGWRIPTVPLGSLFARRGV